MGITENDSSVFAIVSSVLSAVLKIALLVAVGCKLEVQGMLNGQKRKCLSALAMDVCLPCLLFSSVLPEANETLFLEGWQLLLWPLVYATIGSIVGAIACIMVGIPMQHLGSAAACAAFPNVNGFPVSVISALGPALPKSPAGFSPLVFLALIQLTDGCVKYTLGPMVFRRDLRAVQRARLREGHCDHGDLPLGASLRSIVDEQLPVESLDAEPASETLSHSKGEDSLELNMAVGSPAGPQQVQSRVASMSSRTMAIDPSLPNGKTEFGLVPEQFRVVEPEWSRYDAGNLVWSARQLVDGAGVPIDTQPPEAPGLQTGLLHGISKAGSGLARWTKSLKAVSSQLLPPQVVAVLLALAFGMGPVWVKKLLIDPEVTKAGGQPYMGFVFGTAKQLGGGFVPLQMISLGGRLVNIVGPSGPLAEKGAAGPRGRAKLLKLSATVGVCRMVLAPAICFMVALAVDRWYLFHTRPLAFWAPALIVSAMPTANNMSTMADLVGSGRSISAASTAMQLLASPAILAVSLTALVAGAQYQLASDFVATS